MHRCASLEFDAASTIGRIEPFLPAIGYVPEVPWNDSCANPFALVWEQDMANEIFGYPTSDVSTPEQACNFIFDYSFTQSGSSYGLGYYYPYGEYLLQVVGGSGGASSCVVNSTNPSSTTPGTCTSSATVHGHYLQSRYQHVPGGPHLLQ